MRNKRIDPTTRFGKIRGNQEIVGFSRYLESGRHIYKIICHFCNNEYESSFENWNDKRRTGKSCRKCSNHQNKDYSRLTVSDAQVSIMYSNYKSRAKSKGWEFSLEREYFKILVSSKCHYCGIEPNKIRLDRVKNKRQDGSVSFLTNGVDRLDSNNGYVMGNVVTCCEDCNKAKRNLSYSQFLNLIERIYLNINSKNHK